jgi:hypothetical protein
MIRFLQSAGLDVVSGAVVSKFEKKGDLIKLKLEDNRVWPFHYVDPVSSSFSGVRWF